ncbi:MAG: pro-sigmaK processing inhibitor BofA family protein [Oscillospiraceae bacterium]
MKKLFTAAFMGVLALLAVNITGAYTGISLLISPLSLTVSSVLGIPGVITLLILERMLI